MGPWCATGSGDLLVERATGGNLERSQLAKVDSLGSFVKSEYTIVNPVREMRYVDVELRAFVVELGLLLGSSIFNFSVIFGKSREYRHHPTAWLAGCFPTFSWHLCIRSLIEPIVCDSQT